MVVDFDAMEKSKGDIFRSCLCPTCPSWVECGEQGGFCVPSVGKSKCIGKAHGCVCPICPIATKFKLKHDYYCMKGSEKERANERPV